MTKDTTLPPLIESLIDREQIRKIFMRHGFKISTGHTDTKERLYAAGEELALLGIAAALARSRSQHDADSKELRSLCEARDEARRERDKLRAELERMQQAQQAQGVPEPRGWIVWWPRMGGGYVEHWRSGERRPSFGPELDALLKVEPVYAAAPQAEPVHIQDERDALREAQAAAVMPLIGPLLDAWENADREVMDEEPELAKWLSKINRAMEEAGEEDPQQAEPFWKSMGASSAEEWERFKAWRKAEPQQAEPLSDEQIDKIHDEVRDSGAFGARKLFARAIEAAHGIGTKGESK